MHLDNWLKRKGLKSGYDMPIQTCWELAQVWYTGRLEHDWKRPDREEAQNLFKSLGLEGEFWNLK